MRFPDPYALRMKSPRETILFAASQLTGGQALQEDYFLNFNDECFVLADGVGTRPHGDVASKFASETAIWAYKHIRQHRYYWLDKKLFMKRIFRSTNLAVWQKQREAGYEDGLATSLMVLLVGAKHYWLGVAGDSCAWLIHNGSTHKITPEVNAFSGAKPDVLGNRRLGLIPFYRAGAFSPGDVLILTSAGSANYLTPLDIQTSAASVGSTLEEVTRAAEALLHASAVNGSKENMTGVIVKRVEST